MEDSDLEEVISRLENTIYVFSVVVVVLLLLIIFLFVCLYFIFCKLRYHEQSIHDLEEKNELSHAERQSNDDNLDHAVDIETDEITTVLPEGKPENLPAPNDRNIQSNMTLMIEKETVNVYGNTPQIGQVMRLAQDFYKVKTNTVTDVPAESVQVLDKSNNRRTAHSMIFTDDWSNGCVPTSLLFNNGTGSFQDMMTQNEGIFLHKTIGPEGGRMDISGIRLVVPPNAIKESTLISIGLLWDQNYVPNLTKKQTLLSPLVLCQPSGIIFQCPVTLSFPHSAINITQDWNAQIQMRGGNLNDNADWSTITLRDYTERNITENRIELSLNHFTLYTCVGESKSGKVAAKGIQLVAFASSPSHDDFFKPRIYCLNDYTEEIDEVKTLERDTDAQSKVFERCTLVVHDNNQDVLVDVATLSDGWKHVGGTSESIQFELIWHALRPHCSFIFKPVGETKHIYCELQASQRGRENFSGKLKIAAQVIKSHARLNTDDLTNGIISELTTLLDPENVVKSNAGDWRDLAEKMGCGIARIRWLKLQGSPTKVLITKWIEDENKPFEDLVVLLREINRPDAADEVTKQLSVVQTRNNQTLA